MAVTKGIRGFEPPPRLIGRDPMDYAKPLQDWLEKLYQQSLGGRPPIHGTHHRLDGQDPLDAPTTIPGTVSGDSLSEHGTDPLFARAGHNHALDDAGTPGTVATVAAQGVGPGVSLNAHTHRLGIATTKGDLIVHDGTDPVRVAVGVDALQLTARAGATAGLQWGPMVLSPAQITADQNDYAPGRANVYRITSDALRTITGLVAGTDGEWRTIINVGANEIILSHQNVGSAAANRFICGASIDISLLAENLAILMYDVTTARWRAFEL